MTAVIPSFTTTASAQISPSILVPISASASPILKPSTSAAGEDFDDELPVIVPSTSTSSLNTVPTTTSISPLSLSPELVKESQPQQQQQQQQQKRAYNDAPRLIRRAAILQEPDDGWRYAAGYVTV
ncbi:hypothetical protein HK100_007693 [Physocladia obscura]|uniref:Uncharacterized protein n=1 Tax=Physocladia obscura TaxID=109957 RepID=A0AAD5SNN7_9FUNG|nr:hypothetical protein HK100_007693 [Physocladia obscura]